MIDFLKDCGLSDIEIQQIEDVNSSANLYNLNCNEFDVIKMMNYLNEIGIKNKNDLLMYRIDLFFTSFDTFKDKFEKYDRNKIVDLVNQDYTIIDKIIIKGNFL